MAVALAIELASQRRFTVGPIGWLGPAGSPHLIQSNRHQRKFENPPGAHSAITSPGIPMGSALRTLFCRFRSQPSDGCTVEQMNDAVRADYVRTHDLG